MQPLSIVARQAVEAALASRNLCELLQLAGLFLVLADEAKEAARSLSTPDSRLSKIGDRPTDEPLLLTAAEAAKEAGPSYTARWFYRHAHELPFAKRHGRSLRFYRPGLRAWQAQLRP